MVENEENLTALLEDREKLGRFVERIFEYELDVVYGDADSLRLSKHRERRNMKEGSELDAGLRLLKHIKSHSAPEDLIQAEPASN